MNDKKIVNEIFGLNHLKDWFKRLVGLYNDSVMRKVFKKNPMPEWTNFKWEKTEINIQDPVGKENLEYAIGALEQLKQFYDMAKMYKAEDMRKFSSGGMFHSLWQRMLTTDSKLEALAEYNSKIAPMIDNLYNGVYEFQKALPSKEVSEDDKPLQEVTLVDKFGNPIPDKSTDSAEDTATRNSADNTATVPKKRNRLSAKNDDLLKELCDILIKRLSKKKDDIQKLFCPAQIQQASDSFYERELKSLRKTLQAADEKTLETAIGKYNSDLEAFIDSLLKIDPDDFERAVVSSKKPIKWQGNKMRMSVDNIYIAENALFRISVFFGGFALGYMSTNQGGDSKIGKKMISALSKIKSSTDEIVKCVKAYSGFGSLTESLSEKVYRKIVAEERMKTAIRKMKESVDKANNVMNTQKINAKNPADDLKLMTEAFANLKHAVGKRPADDETAKNRLSVSDFASYSPTARLNAMKEVVYEDVPMNEAEDDEEDAAGGGKEEVTPAVPMTMADPETGEDPFADAPGAETDDAPAGGEAPDAPDMGTAPSSDAPAGDMPDAGGTPPAGGNAAPAGEQPAGGAEEQPAKANAVGEVPDDKDAEDKFDIGVNRAVNKTTDPLDLTENEQEQLFSKINLLAKVPDMVNFSKYLYNITPENVDLDDVHYINTLYKLSIRLGLLTDEFPENLLDKYDNYTYTVISKNPEKTLADADAEMVSETSRKIKTDLGETELVDAPYTIEADSMDDYIAKLKKQQEEEADKAEEARGKLGWMITFCASFYGMPALRTEYFKQRRGMKPEEVALPILEKKGYKDISILAVEKVDPVEYLYTQYTGMIRLEDLYTEKYIKNLLGESSEAPREVSESVINAVDDIVCMFNSEMAVDPRLDFEAECGVSKPVLVKEDVLKSSSPISEGCICTVKKGDGTGLSRMLFSDKCRLVCRTMAECAKSNGVEFEADMTGENTVHFTFRRS